MSFQKRDNPTPETEPLLTLFDRHITDLGFAGRVKMEATYSNRPGTIPYRHMEALVIQDVAFRAPRLLPRFTQNPPTKIEILLPFSRRFRAALRKRFLSLH